ncbi:hypothetical protein B4U80_10370, partial [Leptotrombidium deliense]
MNEVSGECMDIDECTEMQLACAEMPCHNIIGSFE